MQEPALIVVEKDVPETQLVQTIFAVVVHALDNDVPAEQAAGEQAVHDAAFVVVEYDVPETQLEHDRSDVGVHATTR